jgi:hypothetical protein
MTTNSAGDPWRECRWRSVGFYDVAGALGLRRPLDSIAGVVAGCAAIAILSMRCSCSRARIRRRSSPTSRCRWRRPSLPPLCRGVKPATPRSSRRGPDRTWSPTSSASCCGAASMTGGGRGLWPEDRHRDPRLRAGGGPAPLGRTERHAAGVDRALGRQGAAGPDPAQRSDRGAARAQRPHRRGAARAHRFRLRSGQPTGIYDTETRAAIERFEKARRRPVTGQISDLLVRDLAALTGRPLE